MTGASMNWLGHLKVRLFPPVTQRMALDIARQALNPSESAAPLICHARRPAHFSIYAGFPEPCWWIQVPWGDGRDGQVLRGSRVMVVGRNTGTIHYDGSANDEG